MPDSATVAGSQQSTGIQLKKYLIKKLGLNDGQTLPLMQ
jgi:hypothetical protein